jgi:hypothetical protein
MPLLPPEATKNPLGAARSAGLRFLVSRDDGHHSARPAKAFILTKDISDG